MASALTGPPRAFRPLHEAQNAPKQPRPMPAPISRVALAARQNHVLALQALQSASASPSGTKSPSSSAQGSPPPNSPHRPADDASSAKRSRKFQACRTPPTSSPLSSSTSTVKPSSAKQSVVPLVTTSVPHWAPQGTHPLIDPASGKRSDIYSLVNDRYPGAPGTALAKAREAQQKSLQLAKREAAKKLASKAELEHLGVKGLGKKRKSSSPYATVGNSQAGSSQPSSFTVPLTSVAMSRGDSTQSRGRNTVKTSADGNSLTVPSSSRSRRPTSRASSPAPLVSQMAVGRRSGTRSGSAVPAEDDNKSAPSSRPPSPPEGSKNVLGLASTAPFQSSPLAASAITLEPLLDHDDIETPSIKIETSPSVGRSSAMKRKASALNQELRAEDAAQSVQAGIEDLTEDPSKRFKPDEEINGATDAPKTSLVVEQEEREGSPSSSRRTSPRMPARRIVSEVA